MERIFITGSMARNLRRMARRDVGIKLKPLDEATITPLSSARVTLSSLGLDGLCTALVKDADKPIDLWVPSAGSRIRAKGIRSHVCSTPLPKRSFDILLPADNNPLNLPNHIQVLVDSPQLAFATAAQQLQRALTKGGITEIDARSRLLKIGLEDCSTYSLDPWQPQLGNCAFNCAPCLTADDLRRYLGQLHHFDGCTLAREVSKWVFDGSASPMESLINAAYSLPTRMGSLCLGNPVANKTIALSEVEHMKLNHIDHITPDLLWEALRIVIEYLGVDPHSNSAAHQEDMNRIQDYQSLGYIVFPVLYEHVRTPEAFNELALRVAAAMEQRGLHGAQAHVERLVADQEFLARQRSLFAIMLPAVSDR